MIVFAYFQGLLTWLSGGQTVGKACVGLTTRGSDYSPIGQTPADLARLLARFSIGYVVFDVFLVGGLYALVDRWRRCPHDIVFGTQVVGSLDGVNVDAWDDRFRQFEGDVQAGLALVWERWKPFYRFAKWSSKLIILVSGVAAAVLVKLGVVARLSHASAGGSAPAPAATSSAMSLTAALGSTAITVVIATSSVGAVADESSALMAVEGVWYGDWGYHVAAVEDGELRVAYDWDDGIAALRLDDDGVLRGWWREPPAASGPETGRVEFRILDDGSLDGRWAHVGEDGWRENWDVELRSGEERPSELVERLYQQRRYDDLWRP